MKIRRDKSIDGSHSMLRLNKVKKEEINGILLTLRNLLGTRADKDAHTVQIVFTGDKNETVLTVS